MGVFLRAFFLGALLSVFSGDALKTPVVDRIGGAFPYLQIYKYELFIANIVFACVNTVAPEVDFSHSRPQIAGAV